MWSSRAGLISCPARRVDRLRDGWTSGVRTRLLTGVELGASAREDQQSKRMKRAKSTRRVKGQRSSVSIYDVEAAGHWVSCARRLAGLGCASFLMYKVLWCSRVSERVRLVGSEDLRLAVDRVDRMVVVVVGQLVVHEVVVHLVVVMVVVQLAREELVEVVDQVAAQQIVVDQVVR